jgi:hypothetical protein
VPQVIRRRAAVDSSLVKEKARGEMFSDSVSGVSRLNNRCLLLNHKVAAWRAGIRRKVLAVKINALTVETVRQLLLSANQ